MSQSASRAGLALLAVPIAGLLFYKWPSAWERVAGVLGGAPFVPRAPAIPLESLDAWSRPFVAGVNYLLVVWPALAFGLVVSACVRAFLPGRWLERLVDRGTVGGQLAAAAAAAPLMLCSCCVAPIFGAVHARKRKFGPAAALLLGAPSLNPAALALTFVMFGSGVGATRAVMAVAAVLLVGPAVERLVGREGAVSTSAAEPAEPTGSVLGRLASAMGHTVERALPPVVLGVFLSAALTEHVDLNAVGGAIPPMLAAPLLALFVLPLALPTFFELPIGLALAAGGAPDGAVAAVLFAGPAINLPSLLSVARESSVRAAAALAAGVWIVASVVGVLVP